MAQQTPKQRAANAKWAKQNTKKQGQPRKEGKKSEFPVSRTWLLVLLFLVCGGAILELIRMFFLKLIEEVSKRKVKSIRLIKHQYDDAQGNN